MGVVQHCPAQMKALIKHGSEWHFCLPKQVDILYLHNAAESAEPLGQKVFLTRLADAFAWLESARTAGRIQVSVSLLYSWKVDACQCSPRPDLPLSMDSSCRAQLPFDVLWCLHFVLVAHLQAYGLATWDCFRKSPDNGGLQMQQIVKLAQGVAGSDHGFRCSPGWLDFQLLKQALHSSSTVITYST